MPWNAIAAGISGLFGNSSTDKQLKAQAVENEKNRQYNLQLAKMQNQWNVDQWNRENEYNSPAQQMARYKAAGLNPDLIYGQSNTSSQLSGSLTSGAPSSPQDMSPMARKVSPLAGAFGSIAQSRLLDAQIRNIDADTEKKKNEATGQGYQNEILKSDAAFREAINQGTLDLGNMQIKGIEANVLKTDAETEKIRNEISLLKKEIDSFQDKMKKVRSETALLNEKVKTELVNRALNSRQVEASIALTAAQTGKTKAETRALVEKLTYEVMNLQANTSYLWEQKGVAQLEGDILELSMPKNVSDAEYVELMKYWSFVWRGVGEATGAVGNIFSGTVSKHH